MQHLSGLWGEIVAWAAILAGVSVVAGLLVRIDLKRPKAQRTDATISDATILEAPGLEPTLDRQREWDVVMHHASEGLSRGADLAALQANTALKIASAEHAYNRLRADCGRFLRLPPPAPAAAEPPDQVVSSPEMPPGEPNKPADPQPLAA